MRQTLVLGSGFGLYGYAPALIARGDQVLIPENYCNTVKTRDDLSVLENAFHYCHEKDAKENVDEIVIARAPLQQMRTLASIKRQRSLDCLYLEKPVATSPEHAHEVLSMARNKAEKVKIGYLFRYLDWYKQLEQLCTAPSSDLPVSIKWKFKAHHWRFNLETWKKDASAGGGVLRFYGIHIIAVAAKLGYQRCVSSELFGRNSQQPTGWQVTFIANNKRDLLVEIDSNAETSKFLITTSTPIVEQAEPFSSLPQTTEGRDLRSLVIRQYLDEDYSQSTVNWYDSTLDLWAMTEANSHFNQRVAS